MLFHKAVASQWSGSMWNPKGATAKQKENNPNNCFWKNFAENMPKN